jgi:hypothetical protein
MPENKQLPTHSKGSKTNDFHSATYAPELVTGSGEKQASLNYSNPRSLEPKNLLALQRIIGNQAVQRMITAHKGQPAAISSRSSSKGVIQRHASHEHKMLGDVDPADLEIIASASNLNDQGKAVKKDENGDEVELKIGGTGEVIKKDMILHTLEQEINRIKFFRDHPPATGNNAPSRKEYTQQLKMLDSNSRAEISDKEHGEGTGELEKAESKDWQVVVVSIPSAGGGDPLLVTYGEMNTLADIYGNVEELKRADPKNRWEVLQGIRQLSMFNFMNIYDKVSGKSNFSSKANPMRVGEGFDGGTGVTGRGGGLGNMVGEVRFMMGGKKKTKGKGEQDYTPGLGRNACHFAPESWYSWAKYHRDAEALAQQAYGKGQEVEQIKIGRQQLGGRITPVLQERIDKLESEQDVLENEALLANGFGDHFLQDSYAAGHLINKTQVMKWFVEWMDAHPFKADYTKDENWRKNQAIAYNQDEIGFEKGRYDVSKVAGGTLAKDTQSVENMEDNDDGTSNWEGRFSALGLKVPDSLRPGSTYFDFMLFWQGRAAHWYRTRGLKLSDVPTEKFSEAFARDGIKQLVKEGIARVNWTGSSHTDVGTWDTKEVKKHSYLLNPDYVPKDSDKFDKLVVKLNSKNPARKNEAQEQYSETAKKITYRNYHEFLGNSLLQAGTNVLHNYFCLNGLEVETGMGDNIGRIYGDYSMLAKDSAKGVKYSSETSHMSRDAIIDTYTTGTTTKTTDSIAKRFPTKAKGSDGKVVGLDKWHDELKVLVDTSIFAQAQSGIAARAGGLKGNDLGKISKDVDVHKGESF